MRRSFLIGVATVAMGLAFAIDAPLGAAAGSSGLSRISGTASPAASNASDPMVAAVDPATAIDFEVQLNPSAAAQGFATAVSTPGNPAYGRFLTPAQWERDFSPTAGQVGQATSFLLTSGFTVTGVSADRMAIDASGPAAQVDEGVTQPDERGEGHHAHPEVLVRPTAEEQRTARHERGHDETAEQATAEPVRRARHLRIDGADTEAAEA